MESLLVRLARGRQLGLSGAAREIRIGAGIRLAELAEQLEVDPTTLWRWETGKSVPRRDAALRWEEKLAELASIEVSS